MENWMFAGLVMLIVFFIKDWFSGVTLKFTTDGTEALLLGAHSGYLSNIDWQELATLVANHAVLENMLFGMASGDVIARIRSWAQFNVDGQRKLCFSSEIRAVCPTFFNKVKLEGANAWVLKVFVALPGPYQESSSHYTSSLDFQGSNTALLEDTHNFWVPHQVDIVDVQVPEGMVGGEIQIFEPLDHEWERQPHNYKYFGPAYIEKAEVNKLVSISGQAYYTWTDFSLQHRPESPQEAARVSLILEQYKIGNESYSTTGELELWSTKARSYKGVYAFSAVLFGCGGAAVGAISSRQAVANMDIVGSVVPVLVGSAVAACIGMVVAFSFVNAAWGLQVILRAALDLVETHYVYSPEVTAWFVITIVGSIFWMGILECVKYYFDRVNPKARDEIKDFINTFASGEAALTKRSAKEVDAVTGSDKNAASNSLIS